jgi:hypothetical protein
MNTITRSAFIFLCEIDDELSSSFNDSSEMSSIYETFSTSVSFVHLNIQSLVPKLDLIYAEYEHWLIKSGPEALLGFNIDKTSSTSVSLISISQSWFS